MNQIKKEGKLAFFTGKDSDENPYPDKTDERRSWYEGWCEARLAEHLSKHPDLR